MITSPPPFHRGGNDNPSSKGIRHANKRAWATRSSDQKLSLLLKKGNRRGQFGVYLPLVEVRGRFTMKKCSRHSQGTDSWRDEWGWTFSERWVLNSFREEAGWF